MMLAGNLIFHGIYCPIRHLPVVQEQAIDCNIFPRIIMCRGTMKGKVNIMETSAKRKVIVLHARILIFIIIDPITTILQKKAFKKIT